MNETETKKSRRPAHSPGPWSPCHHGNCQCRMIWNSDGQYVIAIANQDYLESIHLPPSPPIPASSPLLPTSSKLAKPLETSSAIAPPPPRRKPPPSNSSSPPSPRSTSDSSRVTATESPSLLRPESVGAATAASVGTLNDQARNE